MWLQYKTYCSKEFHTCSDNQNTEMRMQVCKNRSSTETNWGTLFTFGRFYTLLLVSGVKDILLCGHINFCHFETEFEIMATRLEAMSATVYLMPYCLMLFFLNWAKIIKMPQAKWAFQHWLPRSRHCNVLFKSWNVPFLVGRLYLYNEKYQLPIQPGKLKNSFNKPWFDWTPVLFVWKKVTVVTTFSSSPIIRFILD